MTADTAGRWQVYILRCGDGSLYTGITNNIEQRIIDHNAGTCAKYTRSRLPVKLIYSETVEDKSSALQREAAIKKLTRAAKLELIRS